MYLIPEDSERVIVVRGFDTGWKDFARETLKAKARFPDGKFLGWSVRHEQLGRILKSGFVDRQILVSGRNGDLVPFSDTVYGLFWQDDTAEPAYASHPSASDWSLMWNGTSLSSQDEQIFTCIAGARASVLVDAGHKFYTEVSAFFISRGRSVPTPWREICALHTAEVADAVVMHGRHPTIGDAISAHLDTGLPVKAEGLMRVKKSGKQDPEWFAARFPIWASKTKPAPETQPAIGCIPTPRCVADDLETLFLNIGD